MIFTPLRLEGAFVIDLEPRADDRGFFARAWCRKEFEAAGIHADFVQANLASSLRKGTLRGLHYQVSPHEEAKLLRCIRGAVFDVMVDLRAGSPTFRQWFGAELTADNRQMAYVPEGFAHGYVSLVDDTEVLYHVSAFYAPGAERGCRWDDPAFGIQWPRLPEFIISEKDRNWP
ncbi:MAG: dTDP-4-dehydrorhamnose 3,5-epimerase, partial [Desulfobacterales bacterium]